MTALSPSPGFGAPLLQSPQQSQVEKVKRPSDKRVSWATGEKLCQIRFFAVEVAPAMSGSVQEQLRAKQARNLQIFNSTIPAPATDTPGFGGVAVKSVPDHIALAAIVPQISWMAPSTVYIDPTWHVMAGGASLEFGLQKQRELRTLEAVYPRPSSIPESPAEPVEAQDPYDDSRTRQIPLVPLEAEDLPGGSDMSSLSSGPHFLSHGSSGQVAGVQTTPPNDTGLSNGRPNKVKQYAGDNLSVPIQENSHARNESAWRDPPAVFIATSSFVDHSSDLMNGRRGDNLSVPIQENSHARNESAWRDPPAVFTARPSFVDHSSDLMNGRREDNLSLPIQENSPSRKESAWRAPPAVFTARSSFGDHSSALINGTPPPAGPVSDVHSNSKHNGVKPDAATAATAAFAALTKFEETSGMIDNDLLIQILKDPSLIHSLTAKSRTALANWKSELSSSINLKGASRGPEKINQAQPTTGVTGGGDHWISPPSTSYIAMPAGRHNGSGSRSGESYSTAGERFQRAAGSDERSLALLPGSVGNGQLLYTDTTNARVGPCKSSNAPTPGFGNGKSNGNARPGFGSKSASHQGAQAVAPAPPQAQAGPAPARPFSLLDEQYYKSLIMQHGCKSADDNDHGRTVTDKGDSGARSSNSYSTSEAKKWYGGREELDGARLTDKGKSGARASNSYSTPEGKSGARACNSYSAPEGKKWYGGTWGREELGGARPERSALERRHNERKRTATAAALQTVMAIRAKSRKVCNYFGTARGCRNGDNCTYVHELSQSEKTRTPWARSSAAPAPHEQYAKRLRVDG